MEIDAIKALSDAGQIVIAAGGGGIPVLEQEEELTGASAVIEKDLISGKLACLLDADELLILTSVEHVSVNYHSDTQKPKLEKVSVSELKDYMKAGQFEDNTMLPKIQASVAFVEEKPGRRAVITSIGKAKEGYLGKTGTIITA
nr:hypothetical protein [Blautia argi]